MKVQSNGMVRLFIRSDRAALQVRASKNVAAKIRESGNNATIRFEQGGIALAVGKDLDGEE